MLTLGRLIWSQAREIRVENYAAHIVYIIPSNTGSLTVLQDKKSGLLQMPPPRKSDFARGLETLMNDPRTSPFTDHGHAGFKAVISESGMPLSQVLTHIGKGRRSTKPKPPTDAQKSAARTEALETSTEGEK